MYMYAYICTYVYVHMYVCIHRDTCMYMCMYNLQLDGNTSPWFPVRAPSTGVTIQRKIGQGLPWSRGHTLMLVPLVLVEGVHSFFEGGEAARKIYTCIYVYVHIYIYIYIYVHAYCTYVYLYVYVYVYM